MNRCNFKDYCMKDPGITAVACSWPRSWNSRSGGSATYTNAEAASAPTQQANALVDTMLQLMCKKLVRQQ